MRKGSIILTTQQTVNGGKQTKEYEYGAHIWHSAVAFLAQLTGARTITFQM